MEYISRVDFPFVFLFKLSANLPEDIKKFIGTILISEMLHAVRNRGEKKRNQFCIFVDEFQNFASSDDMRTLITEGRKFGSAITFAHQERFGQFANNQKLMGATLAAANKVIFQSTVIDSKELAPEFAKEAVTTETRLEPQLIVISEPFTELMKKGHTNPQIMQYLEKYLWPIQTYIEGQKNKLQQAQNKRTAFLDQASLYRDQASMSQADERAEGRYNAMARGRAVDMASGAIGATQDALEQMHYAHTQAQEQDKEITHLQWTLNNARLYIDDINKFLSQLMRGETRAAPGNDFLAKVLLWLSLFWINIYKYKGDSLIIKTHLNLLFGDRTKPYAVPAYLAQHFWPEEIEKIFLAMQKPIHEKWYQQTVKNTDESNRKYNTHTEYGKTVEEMLQEDLEYFRQEKVTVSAATSVTKSKYHEFGISIPNLSERIFDETLRKKLIEENRRIMVRNGRDQALEIMETVTAFLEFCGLLQLPENHMRVASGQYVEKQVHVRQVHDMSDEMAQELSNLPRFHAYAKIIEEQDNAQTVWKGKIQTPPPTSIVSTSLEAEILKRSYELCMERTEIEKEIRARQEKWRRVQTTTTSEPPQTPKPPPTSD